MNHLKDFHPRSFDIASNESDLQYFTKHSVPPMLDQGGYKAIEALYHTLIQESDTILDLMCGSDSHMPSEVLCENLIGIDLNPQALKENSALTRKITQDINDKPELPLKDNSVDYICLCCVFEYLRHPFTTLEECLRVLKPGGRIIISFTSRFLPLRATALWQALENQDRQGLIKVLLTRAGFTDCDQGEVHPPEDQTVWKDPIYSVVARKA
ncbi:Ubiquinone/menaquinone biosynthesis C-methylase UbiE/MenG (UbiE) (PDB:4OBW) [Commensalibacter communis]|uniref:class I SAM-dependent methyltransferase n=1 Tax=Commensalibacter communis TaxID=2972786 RepID=UPI0022FF898F|nr:class I SAM-dependent methyltransferase [Commensalibacter communis]CAI3956539.1 Ubiquinone/menaquinone biosynthesis C-methylase UbiE/MenG (UbiE) (PDB:4OBW) [Commensalibacter communis]